MTETPTKPEAAGTESAATDSPGSASAPWWRSARTLAGWTRQLTDLPTLEVYRS